LRLQMLRYLALLTNFQSSPALYYVRRHKDVKGN
jgi:hypothetical protein